MSRTIRSTALATVTLALLAGTAAAADAPAVGPQETFTGHRAPVSVPGNHLHRGDRIPKGAVLVSRVVTSSGAAGRRRFTLTLPKGKTLTGLAVAEGSAASIQVDESAGSYVGRRRATVVAVARKGVQGETTVYGYGR